MFELLKNLKKASTRSYERDSSTGLYVDPKEKSRSREILHEALQKEGQRWRDSIVNHRD